LHISNSTARGITLDKRRHTLMPSPLIDVNGQQEVPPHRAGRTSTTSVTNDLVNDIMHTKEFVTTADCDEAGHREHGAWENGTGTNLGSTWEQPGNNIGNKIYQSPNLPPYVLRTDDISHTTQSVMDMALTPHVSIFACSIS